MARCSGAIPTSCQTLSAATANDASMASDASPPDTPLGRRRPIVALTRKPISGKSGISASISPLERRERVGVERLAMAEERDDERQADGGFGGGDGHHEERDDLAVDVAAVAAERHERQVHGVQHDLDRQQNRDQVTAQEHAGRPDREKDRRDDQVVTERDHGSVSSLRASTTAPTIATRMRIDVASKANAWRLNRTRPSSRTELTAAASVWPPTGVSSSAIRSSAHASWMTSSPASSAPKRPTPGRRSGCARSHSAASSFGALSSMTTKRNSTMMAPA